MTFPLTSNSIKSMKKWSFIFVGLFGSEIYRLVALSKCNLEFPSNTIKYIIARTIQ